MTKTSMEVVQEFGQGLASGTEIWTKLVSDSVIFTGPVDQVKGKEAFVKLNKDFMPMIRRHEMKNAVEAGNFVATQVVIDVKMPNGKIVKLDMSEWYEVTNGKIKNIKVYYDAEEFRKELAFKK